MQGNWRTAPAPDGWSSRPITELVDFPSGQVDPRNEPYRSMVLVAPDHIGAATGNLLSKVSAAAQGAISGKYLFAPGDVVYSKIRPYLRKAILADFEGLSSADMYPLRSRDGVVPRFLLAIILGEHFSRFAEIVSMRSGFPKINREEFSEYIASIPSILEQRRIAEILDTLDGAIRKTEQLITKLKQVKRGLLHDLLTHGIDENGELRDPERNPEQFKNSPLGRIPREWDVSSVEEEFEITSGITLGPHRHPKKNKWPYLRVANVHRDALDLSDIAELELLPSELNSRQLAPGDLLVVEGHANPSEIGRCALATEAVAGYIFQNHLFRLRPHRLSSSFGLLWMNSLWARDYWRRVCATSSGLNTINKTGLRRLPVLTPKPDEQALIANRSDALAKELAVEAHELNKLRLIKQGLMEDLLTGRVRVTHLLSENTP